MRIRVIRAPTMADAMRLLTAELGPDAVLLSSRRVAGGVEATAATDLQPEEPPLAAYGLPPGTAAEGLAPGGPGEATGGWAGARFDAPAMQGPQEGAAGPQAPHGADQAHAPQGAMQAHAPNGAMHPHAPDGATHAHPLNVAMHPHAPHGAIHPHAPQGAIHPHAPQGAIHPHAPAVPFHAPQGAPDPLAPAGAPRGVPAAGAPSWGLTMAAWPEPAEREALAFHNLPPALAERLGAGPLEATLAATLRFGRLPEPDARPLLLAGPPGAGKTLTCVKLAARRVLGGDSPPLIVNCDQQRPGALEQLVGVAEALGAPLQHAATAQAALQAIALRPPGGAVLIDTPGIDPFDPEQARQLAVLMATTRASMALVLPAGLDPAEAADLARAFKALGATHLVPTRLDAARRLGGVLAAATAAGLVLAEAGTGSETTAGLMPLNAGWLAARLRRRSHAPTTAMEGAL
jgi:flagellar biosynthesis protein FlhF